MLFITSQIKFDKCIFHPDPKDKKIGFDKPYDEETYTSFHETMKDITYHEEGRRGCSGS